MNKIVNTTNITTYILIYFLKRLNKSVFTMAYKKKKDRHVKMFFFFSKTCLKQNIFLNT